MVARLCSFLIWALVAATAVFWGLRLGARAPAAPPNAVAAGESGELRADLTRLLGAPRIEAPVAMASPELASRFRLLGVMAPKRAGATGESRAGGVALIAVDGKPPKAYSVGARVEDDLVLQSVSLRAASIGPQRGAEAVKLELPPLVPAATGSLPGAVNEGVGPPIMVRPVGGINPIPNQVPGGMPGQPFRNQGVVPQIRQGAHGQPQQPPGPQGVDAPVGQPPGMPQSGSTTD